MNELCELTDLLMRAQQSIARESEDALKELGLSLAKYNILNALAVAGGRLPFSVLVERLGCVRSNITGLIDRLQDDDLVRRVDHPEDRRMLFAELTDEGRRVIKQAGPTHEVAMEQAFAALTAQQRATLSELLRTLTDPTSAATACEAPRKGQAHESNR